MRVKHGAGFYKEVIDYRLEAEGITLHDVEIDQPPPPFPVPAGCSNCGRSDRRHAA